MKKDNEKEAKKRVLLFKKTTITALTGPDMNRILGGYSIHTEQCNDWTKEQMSGLPSCPNYSN